MQIGETSGMKKEQRSRTIEEPRRHVVSHLAVQLHFAQSIARLLVQFVNDRSLSIDPASCFDECVAKVADHSGAANGL